MTALPFAPRRRGTALLTVLLNLATGGSVQAPGSGAGTSSSQDAKMSRARSEKER